MLSACIIIHLSFSHLFHCDPPGFAAEFWFLFFHFLERMAEQQVARQHTLCLVAKSTRKNEQQIWECQKNPTNMNSYLGKGTTVVIPNCLTASGTPLWKNTMNYIVSRTAILTWSGYDLYDKKSTTGAGSCLPVKLALPLMAHTCTEAHSSCLNMQKIP